MRQTNPKWVSDYLLRVCVLHEGTHGELKWTIARHHTEPFLRVSIWGPGVNELVVYHKGGSFGGPIQRSTNQGQGWSCDLMSDLAVEICDMISAMGLGLDSYLTEQIT